MIRTGNPAMSVNAERRSSIREALPGLPALLENAMASVATALVGFLTLRILLTLRVEDAD